MSNAWEYEDEGNTVLIGINPESQNIVFPKRINKKAEKDYDDSNICEGIITLHFPYAFGHLPIVEYLIEKGVNIELKQKDQQTPLHFIISLIS